MHSRRTTLVLFFLVLAACLAFGQANGKLQIHFMDVGQGDGALLISPDGQVVLFDAGLDMKKKDCSKPVSYLDQLGVKRIDYLFVSHYHSDHIGCLPEVLQQFPLQADDYDRGLSYPGVTYGNYVAAVGSHRKTAQVGDVLRLDVGTSHEVAIQVVALNGAGVKTTNENDLSVSAVISFGPFRAEIGGDLSGDNAGAYKDIETSVAPKVGRLDVYKVHHHCSSHSTNDAWLEQTKPAIGIVSVGDGNGYGHPTEGCLERLHTHGVKTYWTEKGNGAEPEVGLDVVAGNTIVQVEPNASTFTVSYGSGVVQIYAVAGSTAPPSGGPTESIPKYAWSKNSAVYHYANCGFVANIAPANLMQGSSPPPGKTLHKGCPK